MQTQFQPSSFRPASLVAAALTAMLTLVLASAVLAQPSADSLIFPPTDKPFGQSYAKWSEEWWQWALALPVEGHPFSKHGFDCNSANNGQGGPVWFLALSPMPPQVKRSCTIPADTAVFLGLPNVECSDLEVPLFPQGTGAKTPSEQRECAEEFADHIVVSSLFCTLDGKAVANNLGSFRFQSSPFTFIAPTPWIFGATGGTGKAVSDGYFVMLKPLSSGIHTLSCGGEFDFGFGVGNTYHLTVEE